MDADLWGFSNISDLDNNTSDYPESILKEQIDALADKTGYTLYGKSMYMKASKDKVGYGVATIFNVIVPALDDYNKTLLIMYSNPEDNYPVAITVGKSFSEDMEDFNPKYVCMNLVEVKDALKKVLSSDEVMDVIKMLYSKAKNLVDCD